jgi:hypothetical protein
MASLFLLAAGKIQSKQLLDRWITETLKPDVIPVGVIRIVGANTESGQGLNPIMPGIGKRVANRKYLIKSKLSRGRLYAFPQMLQDQRAFYSRFSRQRSNRIATQYYLPVNEDALERPAANLLTIPRFLSYRHILVVDRTVSPCHFDAKKLEYIANPVQLLQGVRGGNLTLA